MTPILLSLALLASQAQPDPLHDLRVAKCGAVWSTVYAHSYSPELTDFYIEEHEAVGLGPEWWYSLIYAASGSNLKPAMRNGPARGLMDGQFAFISHSRQRFLDILPPGTPWDSRALNVPEVSIRNHTVQLDAAHRRKGLSGYPLQCYVFYPANPARAPMRRWRGYEQRHKQALHSAYRDGRIGGEADHGR